MNYYSRHLGDYARDTGHLSPLEHGVYNLLLDRYYITEAGIPADQVYRVARARTEDERAAVDAVLSEFFDLADGVWINSRCEQELELYREKRAKAKASAMARWANQAQESESDATAMRTQCERIESAFDSQCDGNALQSPITNNQKEQKKARSSALTPPRPDDVPEQTWADWLLLRKAVKAPVTQTVLKQARAESEKAGLPLDRFLEVWCARGSRGLQADWLKPNERGRDPDRPQRREL